MRIEAKQWMDRGYALDSENQRDNAVFSSEGDSR